MSNHHTWRGLVGNMRGGWLVCPGRLGMPVMGGLSMGFQHPTEGGFDGEIDTLVGEHGHNAGRWHIDKAWFIGSR